MPAGTRSPARSIVLALLGLVAVIGATGGVIGLWAMRTATDSDRFEARIAELLERQDVSDALAERVMNELVAAIPVRDAVVAVVPGVLQPAADVLLAGVRSEVEDRLAATIRTPEVAADLGAAAGRAHAAAVSVIEGDAVVDGVSVVDGAVRVNLLPVTARALRLLQDVGLYADLVIPDFDRSGDPASQRAELSVALGRELPPDFGEPVVFRSEALDRLGSQVQIVRDLVVLAKRVAWLLLIVGLGLGAVAIRWSVHRWRAASHLVAGVFASVLVTHLVLARVTDRVPDAVEQPGARATVAELVEQLDRSLTAALNWYAGTALVVLVAAAVVVGRTADAGADLGPARRSDPT